jgi:hypothetical protein
LSNEDDTEDGDGTDFALSLRATTTTTKKDYYYYYYNDGGGDNEISHPR